MDAQYTLSTCKVGQQDECGEPSTFLIAVTTVTDNGWSTDARPGGVVGLCERHASTPVKEWS
jgi:hypothetical protein